MYSTWGAIKGQVKIVDLNEGSTYSDYLTTPWKLNSTLILIVQMVFFRFHARHEMYLIIMG